jgi:transposase
LPLYCGIDWATAHHDIAVVDDDGRVVARGRVSNDAPGFAQLLTLLAEAGDSAEHPIPVGIETDRGRWVAALRATGRVIYPINPLAASRYRTRYAVSGAKSDATDAVQLANIIRTDPDAHRPLPPDPLVQFSDTVRLLCRCQSYTASTHGYPETAAAGRLPGHMSDEGRGIADPGGCGPLVGWTAR